MPLVRVQNVAANASLCIQNIQNIKPETQNVWEKVEQEACFCIQSLWTNALIRIQNDGTNGLLLQMPSFTSRLFEQSLLCIQSVRTNAFASYPRFLKQLLAFHPKCLNKCLGSHPKCEQITSFASKMFEQVPFLALNMFEQKLCFYNQHVRTNVLIRTSMFEKIPCFFFFFLTILLSHPNC